jgi:NAD(P)-dependent dehydrogenase (short-subunit alcohol dehydrogenase family)
VAVDHREKESEELRLANQVAIVTGAGSGIGRAIALRLATEGADIGIVYSRRDANAQESALQIEALGRRALLCKADASQPAAMGRAVQQTVQALGRIDCLVNNAAIWQLAPLIDMPEELWDRTVEVNLKAAFVCSQAVARYWRAAGRGGTIVNIGSVQGHRSWPGAAAYAAAKAGLVSLTRSLAVELAPQGVRVNLVSPGAIAVGGNAVRAADPSFSSVIKQEIPLGRMGEGEEVADLVLFLVSEQSTYITGAEIVIDGGLLVRPLAV